MAQRALAASRRHRHQCWHTKNKPKKTTSSSKNGVNNGNISEDTNSMLQAQNQTRKKNVPSGTGETCIATDSSKSKSYGSWKRCKVVAPEGAPICSSRSSALSYLLPGKHE